MSPYGTSPSTNAFVSYNIPSKVLLFGFMKLILSVSVVSRTASYSVPLDHIPVPRVEPAMNRINSPSPTLILPYPGITKSKSHALSPFGKVIPDDALEGVSSTNKL